MRVIFLDRQRAVRSAFYAAAVVLWFARAAAASEMTAPIEQLDAGLLQVMKAGKTTPFQQRYALLAPFIMRAIDLDFILQGAFGAGWAALPPDQRTALTAAFQHYSIATYVANFDEFSGERFELQPPAPGGDTVVRVKIVAGSLGDDAHVLGYVMRHAAGGWKAGDVMADGYISQVAVQQAEIRSLMASGGFAGLLARLEGKAAELAGGTIR